MVLAGSYIRLSAYSALGANFTFRLAKPNKLVTSGLYSYVQHPSYIGKLVIVLGNAALTHGPGGPVGCWLPAWIVEARLLWTAFACFAAFVVFRVTRRRVRQEERMLKETFGEDWEAWHARTKRYVPGLF
jgi:protein-S-isoprenylcysteine O-methyltransferase Ste14